MEGQTILAIGIFLIAYAFIVTEKIHRTIVAMAGGILMILLGILDQERPCIILISIPSDF